MASEPAIDNALPRERQERILERLHQHGRVIAADLAVEFRVSEDSIRRDLRELAARGVCKRVYGGALLMRDPGPITARRREHVEGKRALAAVAARLVGPRQILFIDAGSTNSAIAAALPDGRDLTVVTNAPDVALAVMGRPGFEVLSIGGRIDPKIGGAIGSLALRQIQGIRADLCFPGVCAADADSGLWTIDAEEVVLKRAMIEASGETVLVATREKLLTAATHHTAPVSSITHLVVERATDREILDAWRAAGVSVHLA
ncbi:MAG TPA: DeoR/GlpR family DNA-binding transcription regulator [Kofleriaceae bacterium]|nr:DeoR/GlpR family DNA-binding transcription regulator [Kofleriaceae bacterium]